MGLAIDSLAHVFRLLVPVVPLLLSTVAHSTGTTAGWSDPLTISTSGPCHYHAVADLNHDGRPDLVVPTRSSSTLHIFLNGGARSFAPAAPLSSIDDVLSVAIADLDRDGHQDILAVGFGGQALRVHSGLGDGTFSATSDYPLGGKGHGIAAGDLNGDGWIDVAVTVVQGSDHALILWNDGAGSLIPGPVLTTQESPYYVSAHDLNGDSELDLVITNFLSDSFGVYLNDGAGGFVSLPPSASGASRPGRAAITDFDGDGNQDLAIPHFGADTLTWFQGDGFGGFSQAGAIPAASPSDSAGYWAAAGDLDLDGLTDIVFGNGSAGRINVSRQSAPGVFGAAQEYLAGTNMNSVVLADLDGNGSLDISAASHDTAALVVLFNDVADCNGNLVSDSVDIAGGASTDCDGDEVPDECQITQDSSLDLNTNGVLDSCECLVTRYCVAAPNSEGSGALMDHAGTVSVGLNNLSLLCTGCPPNTSGLFFYGPQQTQVVFGNGYRCVAGPITRTGITVASSGGVAARSLNYSTLPPSGPITAGSTWNFQFWYRNPAAGGAGFNLSDGLSVQFCP